MLNILLHCTPQLSASYSIGRTLYNITICNIFNLRITCVNATLINNNITNTNLSESYITSSCYCDFSIITISSQIYIATFFKCHFKICSATILGKLNFVSCYTEISNIGIIVSRRNNKFAIYVAYTYTACSLNIESIVRSIYISAKVYSRSSFCVSYSRSSSVCVGVCFQRTNIYFVT